MHRYAEIIYISGKNKGTGGKMQGMLEYCIAVGTNLGNKKANMQAALDFLDTAPFKALRVSPVYETEPWGFASDNVFLNACVLVQTVLEPLPMLEKLKHFEKNAGRLPRLAGHYQDRLIDLDIVACGNMVFNSPSLVIPHPQMHKRAFVLDPMKDVCPGWKHPLLQKTAEDLLNALA